jgi:pimeloyl-ACP methyl ester carboxylesterase
MRRGRWLFGSAAAGATWWWWRHVSSPIVRAWAPPAGRRKRAGELSTRTLGAGNRAVILLHGLISSGESFGAGFDVLAHDRMIVVPDLLGFGRSIALERADFGLDAHLDALDSVVEALELTGRRWTVGGHSLGGMLALHWAARHAERVERVVTWGAPLHTSREAALAAIARMGLLERIFALDTPLSRGVCAWSCRHRDLAGWVAAATNPDMPVPLARRTSLHTWAAYRGVMEEVILRSSWLERIERLNADDIPVVLARGAKDPVSDGALAAQLASEYPAVTVVTHPTAGHELPMSDPTWCAASV